jgi:NDP-sugar pyrophosphorylase family protein
MKAMILAAGLGTRLKPWTDRHPKALAEVNGVSLLGRNLHYLQAHGIKEVIVNVHHFADQIVEAAKQYDGWGSRIFFSDEQDEVLETGGGLVKAAHYFKAESDFVLMNVDILTNMDLSAMIQQHLATKAMATLAVSDRNSSRCLLFNQHQQMVGWRNNATGEEKGPVLKMNNREGIYPMAFSGIHILNNSIFSAIQRAGKFSMIDVYLDLCSKYSIQLFDHSGADLIDVGKPESIEQAEAIFK